MKILYCRHNDVRLGFPVSCLMISLLGLSTVPQSHAQWTQFGGPNHAFKADTPALANSWPTQGPSKLWSRELGDGFSTILVDAGRLYTMYRAKEMEVVVCLSAETGDTIWEYAYDSSPLKGHWDEFGRGPRATPLLVDGLVYSIGVAGMMHCLDAKTGKPKWSHDLSSEFAATILEGGYASSPIEHEGKIIVLSGGSKQSIIAFDKTSGKVVWKSLSFANSYSTPVVMRIHGEDHIVALMGTHLIGVDPNSGELKWQFAAVTKVEENAPMPILVAEDTILITARHVGTRCVKVNRVNGKFEVSELWSTRKVRVYHGSVVLVDDHIYTSSSANPPHFLAALDTKTGKVKWRRRGLVRANVLYADRKLIILDANGELALATATPDDLVIHSKVKMLERFAWTAPTLVGTKLYLRDQRRIMALNLGL